MFNFQKGQTEVVKLLMTAPGVDLNEKNNDGETALFTADAVSCRNIKGVRKKLSTLQKTTLYD